MEINMTNNPQTPKIVITSTPIRGYTSSYYTPEPGFPTTHDAVHPSFKEIKLNNPIQYTNEQMGILVTYIPLLLKDLNSYLNMIGINDDKVVIDKNQVREHLKETIRLSRDKYEATFLNENDIIIVWEDNFVWNAKALATIPTEEIPQLSQDELKLHAKFPRW
jgi:hypothetical protein